MHRPPADQLDPSTWIDEQRAGRGGNIFAAILEASRQIREGRQGLSQAWIDRREQRVASIKEEAAQYDAKAEVITSEPATPSFNQLMDRWNRS